MTVYVKLKNLIWSGTNEFGEACALYDFEPASKPDTSPQPDVQDHLFRPVSDRTGGFGRGDFILAPSCLELPTDEMAKLETWANVRKWFKSQYDARRTDKPSGRKINARPRIGGHFVAVDSEGVNVGEPIPKGKGKNRRVIQRQRTVLWMAGGAEGFEDQTLADPMTLDRERIWKWLLTLPRLFAGKNASDPAPIFVGFGFNYDVGQLVAGMSYKKAWELHTGVPWDMRDNDDFPESFRRWVLVGDYAISHIPHKSVVLCKLRNPEKPFRWSEKKKTGERRKAVDWIERIEIYDTRGFFQSNLITAIRNFPGVVSDDEFKTIQKGKEKRGGFTAESLPMLKVYTAAELKALARMMEQLRAGLKFIDPASGEEKQLQVRNWWGAGAIAQALLKAYLGPRPRHILGDMSRPWLAENNESADALEWVTYARFGGRIELCKQGVHKKPLYLYDISSAYPAVAVTLPSMEDGQWIWKANPTREEVENSNILSMFKVETRNFAHNLPFYPLQFRNEKHGIMFPPNIVGGRYMRDDAIAALKFFDYFNGNGLADFSRWRDAPEIIISEALFFIPGGASSRPLSFIRDLFNLRAEITAKNKSDVRGQVIKLGINSVYGKFAQRVGKPGEPPAYGCLWYAAAITAGTRRKLLESALNDPKAVIAFATDAVFSTRPLPLNVPERKTLGEWEFEENAAGSFAQSGVYTIRQHKLDEKTGKQKLKIATRGFSPTKDSANVAEGFADAFERDMFVNIPERWRVGADVYEFEDQVYLGLGASVVPPRTWVDIGSWKTLTREQRLNTMSAKRGVPYSPKLRAARADRLIDLFAQPYTLNPKLGLTGLLRESVPSVPDWMNAGKRKRRAPSYDEAANADNVDAGLEAQVDF